MSCRLTDPSRTKKHIKRKQAIQPTATHRVISIPSSLHALTLKLPQKMTRITLLTTINTITKVNSRISTTTISLGTTVTGIARITTDPKSTDGIVRITDTIILITVLGPIHTGATTQDGLLLSATRGVITMAIGTIPTAIILTLTTITILTILTVGIHMDIAVDTTLGILTTMDTIRTTQEPSSL